MRVEAVEARTPDDVALRGELVAGDDTWVVLVHDVGGDIDAWKPVRPALVRAGWTCLSFDLRGHGGSEGEWSRERAELDVHVPIVLARSHGARHVALVAAGHGALLALRAVEHALPDERLELADSLVLVSPGPLEGWKPASLRAQGLPKLVFFGAQDPFAADAQAIVDASIGWTLKVTVASEAHGTALLEDWEAVVADKTVSFLREQCAVRGPGQARHERRTQSAGA